MSEGFLDRRVVGGIVSVSLVFVGIGFFLLPIIWLLSVVLGIMAGMAANKGEQYRYPFALRLIS